jgi:hypothetical protein
MRASLDTCPTSPTPPRSSRAQVDKELLALQVAAPPDLLHDKENGTPQRSAQEENLAALAAAKLACSRANPGACEMCGS